MTAPLTNPRAVRRFMRVQRVTFWRWINEIESPAVPLGGITQAPTAAQEE